MIIIGGDDSHIYDEDPSQACQIENGQFTCTVEYAYLLEFTDYPLLFVVDNDFKKCWNKDSNGGFSLVLKFLQST